MSTYSRAWMRLTSFPGMGTMLSATLYAGFVCFTSPVGLDVTGSLDDSTTPELDGVHVVEDSPLNANEVGKSGRESAGAVKSGRLDRDRGRGGTATVLLAVR